MIYKLVQCAQCCPGKNIIQIHIYSRRFTPLGYKFSYKVPGVARGILKIYTILPKSPPDTDALFKKSATLVQIAIYKAML